VENKYAGDLGAENRLQTEGSSLINEDEQLLLNNKAVILEGIFGCSALVQLESSIGFARYLSQVGINSSNYPLFLRLLETNNKWVVDALIGKREPHLMFSSIRPNTFLVRKAFLLLSFWHPGQIYAKVLQAILGIIVYAFYNPDDGYRIYKLKINDLNNIGKFLDEKEDQFEESNSLLLNVLDRITQLGSYEDTLRKSILAKHAFDIRIAYFDNRKRCMDVIPQLLMVRLDREQGETKPSKSFINFLKATETGG